MNASWVTVDFGLDCSAEIWENCARLVPGPLPAPCPSGAHVILIGLSFTQMIKLTVKFLINFF